MTSKNLFLKLQREDMKRRVWSIALSMLGFFLLFTVVCAMEVSNYAYRIKTMGEFDSNIKEWIHNQVIRFIGPANELVIVITMVCAVVCGLSGFFYLHSKKKVDLFHSIPVRREKLFAITYLNGLLIYIVPYMINLLLCYIILGINNHMVMEVFLSGLTAFGFNIIYYLLIYTIAIVAVMLTGNIVVSFLGTAVFYLYGSFIVGIKDTYFNEFFMTYLSVNDTERMIVEMSPLGNYVSTADKIIEGYGSDIIGRIIAVIVLIIALIAFATFLYKKRPSEAAGKAMAFEISRPIIKLALVIPISLAGGILFMSISNSHDIAWLIFGLIFALVISYGIIEIIYNFDVRKALHGVYYLLGSAVAVGVIVCIFQFDLFNYDTYIPKQNDVKTISVAIGGLDGYIRYYDFDYSSSGGTYNHNYQLDHMEISNPEPAYELAKIGIEQVKSIKSVNKNYKSMYNVVDTDAINTKFYTYKVKYTLDNERNIYREYTIPVDSTYDLLKDIYIDLDYKKGHYPIYMWNADDVNSISCSNLFEDKKFSLNDFEKKQFIEIYKEELNNNSLDDTISIQPTATLIFETNNYDFNYYVYPTFTNTINFLNDRGFDGTRVVGTEDIKEIFVENFNIRLEDAEGEKHGITYAESTQVATKEVKGIAIDREGTKTYTDPASIMEIYPAIIPGDFYWDNSVFIDVENSIEVIVTINIDDYENFITRSYYFKANEIPEFVIRDINYK
ncbi:MAG TPA: hypothetical protein GX731_02560 [Clostridiales bacterium]|nr:hypothetical protein [Clostridiales bacterium]